MCPRLGQNLQKNVTQTSVAKISHISVCKFALCVMFGDQVRQYQRFEICTSGSPVHRSTRFRNANFLNEIDIMQLALWRFATTQERLISN